MGVVRTSNFARKEAKSVDKKAIRVVPRRYSTGLKSVSTYSFLGPKLKQYKALKAFPPFVDTAVQCVWYIICNAISLPHIEISVNACYHFVEVEIQRKRSSTKLNDRRSISLSGKQAMTVNDASVPRSRN